MTNLQEYYDHIYLSPHFDDVALSCGGRIFRYTAVGDSVLVVTVTAAEPHDSPQSDTVRSLHHRWADSLGELPAAMVARRRAEDREAFTFLRADTLHLPFLDCIYRQGPGGAPLYPGPTDMFGPVNSADGGFADALAGVLTALPPADKVYLPLGVGGHVDHLATRRAGERAFSDAAYDVAYYEDYPYTMAPGALEAVLPPAERGDWTADITWLTGSAMAARVASVGAYRSQLSSFFTGPDDMEAKLREEAARVAAGAQADGAVAPAWSQGAERVWRKA